MIFNFLLSVAVHCYTCDDEVKDNYLAEHLRNFGIEVANQVKTEKTTTEINLQYNLNLGNPDILIKLFINKYLKRTIQSNGRR